MTLPLWDIREFESFICERDPLLRCCLIATISLSALSWSEETISLNELRSWDMSIISALSFLDLI
ncbi:2005_t:CDS:2 [Dentiscutata erythropus]|uniref:2005_t:CDS:1 n=1 Tax=Dentiscutata erythropus TaxID=1348616 RepID=A0A9N9BYT2_9GLOM|nr:2005_t:CDS:2 [Dentiscutata erythropus]